MKLLIKENLKKIFLTLNLIFSLFNSHEISGQELKEFIVGCDPNNGLPTILLNNEPYIVLDYYDWGPKWSRINRKMKSQEINGRSVFSYNSTINNCGNKFEIDGEISQKSNDTISFSATLISNSSCNIEIAQFQLNPGKLFIGSKALVTDINNNCSEFDIPFGRGMVGEEVDRIELIDRNGDSTYVKFSKSQVITMDRKPRFIIARDQIEKGNKYKLDFEIKLPGKIKFYAGADSVAPLGEKWYPFHGKGPIPEESEWSLKNWLEVPAGKYGRIIRENKRLIYHDKEIKLWGINVCYGSCSPTKEMADQRADFYASLGINAIRFHKYADRESPGGILSKDSAIEFDQESLDQMDYFVSALKKRGIYIKLSPLFMVKLGKNDRTLVPFMDEFGKMNGNRLNTTHGSIYLSEELQDILIKQMKEMLAHKNPYTGLTYGEDPVVSYIELFNEDSALFSGVRSQIEKVPTLRNRAGKMFYQWLKNKYGTEDELIKAWGKKGLNTIMLGKITKDESWQGERIYPIGTPWYYDTEQLSGLLKSIRQRMLDTMGFLYELQNKFYSRYEKAIRSMGYSGELIASNWQAGRNISHYYNLHSDSLIGTIDRHNYFGGEGKFSFNSSSTVSLAGSAMLSSSLQQVEDTPFMLSEWIHVYPNEYQVEGPAILGAYGMGLQGWDASFAFQNADKGSFSESLGGHYVWDVMAPQFAGIMPAVSRQVLRGDVIESEATHTRYININSISKGEMNFDDTVTQKWDDKTFTSNVFSSSGLAAVRSVVKFSENNESTIPFDITPYLKEGAIHSSTGQLQWYEGKNNNDGYITINTPGTQAVIGFSNGKLSKLNDCEITPMSHYGAIYLSAHSKTKNISDDNKILISAIAKARNYGAKYLNDKLIFDHGAMEGDGRNKHLSGPVMMEPVKAIISLKRTGGQIYILDHNGVKTGKFLPLDNNKFTIDTGRDSTPYYLIEYK